MFNKTPRCYEWYVDDAAVVAALRSRDEDAFRQLVEAWTPLMTRVARAHVSTDASADEVVQDAWLGVLRGIDDFEGRSSLRTWTFRILTNIAKTRGVRERRATPMSSLAYEPTVALHRFRGSDDDHPGHWKSIPVPWSSPEEAVIGADICRRIGELVAGLPERQRLVISLRDVHGFSPADVCDLLSLSAINQRVLLHRARAAVRAGLEVEYVEGSR